MNDGLNTDAYVINRVRRYLAPSLMLSHCASALFEGKCIRSSIAAYFFNGQFARDATELNHSIHHQRLEFDS
ncbi:MAG: hypothetical protein ABIR27_08045 [Dokdonella sp.]